MDKNHSIFVVLEDKEKGEILLRGTLSNIALLGIIDDSNYDNDTYELIMLKCFEKLHN